MVVSIRSIAAGLAALTFLVAGCETIPSRPHPVPATLVPAPRARAPLCYDLQYYGGWVPHTVTVVGIPAHPDPSGNAEVMIDWGDAYQPVTVSWEKLQDAECRPWVDPPVTDCVIGAAGAVATTLQRDRHALPARFPVEVMFDRGDGRVVVSTYLRLQWLQVLFLPRGEVDCRPAGTDKPHPATGDYVDLCQTVAGATDVMADDGVGLIRPGRDGLPRRVPVWVKGADLRPNGSTLVTIVAPGMISGVDGESTNAQVLALNQPALLRGIC
jgi:hypothetical protein